MADASRLDTLLDGPRGRRLCLSLLSSAHERLWTLAFHAARPPGELPALVSAVADAEVDVTPVALLDALEDAVSTARYWQPPDDTDVLLQNPVLLAALEPVARQVADSDGARWWWSPLAADDQRHVRFTDETSTDPLMLGSTAARLARWKSNALAAESRAASRPSAASANYTGEWWSTPAHANLVSTTRGLTGLGAVELRLIEDSLGWSRADVSPLRPLATSQIFEITAPAAYTELVRRYPLDVSLSRRHDWWHTTGRDGSWVVPDWQAVASDFDAVHLTVAGYLTTAGRALPVGDSATVLAGWGPDATYWLGDVLEPAGPPVQWRRGTADNAWSR